MNFPFFSFEGTFYERVISISYWISLFFSTIFHCSMSELSLPVPRKGIFLAFVKFVFRSKP